MVICVSVDDSRIGLPLLSSTALPALSATVPSGHQAEAAVARQPRAARRADGEVAVAGEAEVERIAGVRQRAGALLAPGRAVLRIGDGAVAARRIGAVLAR